MTVSALPARPHKILEQAFLDAWKKIKEGTGATILYGNP